MNTPQSCNRGCPWFSGDSTLLEEYTPPFIGQADLSGIRIDWLAFDRPQHKLQGVLGKPKAIPQGTSKTNGVGDQFDSNQIMSMFHFPFSYPHSHSHLVGWLLGKELPYDPWSQI